MTLGTGILRFLGGQRSKIRRGSLRSNFIRFSQCGLLLRRRGVRRYIEQNMRSQTLLGLHKTLLFVLVALLQLTVVGYRIQFEVGAVYLNVLHRDLLGVHVFSEVCLVIGLGLRVGYLLISHGRLGQDDVAQIATLGDQAEKLIHLRIADDRAIADRVGQQLRSQRTANIVFKHFRGLALARKKCPIGGRIKLAIQLKLRDRGDVLANGLVAYAHAPVAVGREQQVLVNHRVQDLLLDLRFLQHAGIKLVALLRRRLLTQLVHAVLEVGLADLLLADLRHIRGVTCREVALHAKKRHGKHADAEQKNRRPTVHLVSHCLQHWNLPAMW